MTSDEAIAICHTEKPTPAKMKKVLAWAEQQANPGVIKDLLLLQTGNHANRKNLASDFERAILACSNADPTPLWEVVNEDWETYRVWHALQALAALTPAHQVRRLLELAKQPLNPIHWDVICKAAEAAGVPVAEKMRRQQDEWVSTQSHIEHFARRKTPAKVEAKATIKQPSTMKTVTKQKVAKRAPVTREASQRSGSPLSSSPADPPYLRRFRDSLTKRFKPTRMEDLFQASELAWYLTALERTDEALAVAHYVTRQVTFSGDYNVWTPTAALWGLTARLARLQGRKDEAAQAIDVLRQHPSRVIGASRSAQKKLLAGLHEDFDKSWAEKSQKWACQLAGRVVLPKAALCRETATDGFEHQKTCPVEKFDALALEVLAFLQARLRG